MKHRPSVSVIVPVYNAERFVLDAYASVVNQSLTDLELVFVNDGSTDGSAEVLEAISKNDSRVRVISQTNQGIGGARNAGIGGARGEWIFFLDADDWISGIGTFARLLQRAIETKADAVVPDLDFVSPPDPPHRRIVGLRGDRSAVISGKEALRASINWEISGLALWNTRLFEKWAYDQTCRHFTDEVGTRQLFSRSVRVAFSDGSYSYRQHSSSSTRRPGVRAFDQLVADEMLFQLLSKAGVPDADIDAHLEASFRRLWAMTLVLERYREIWPNADVYAAEQRVERAYGALDRPRTRRQLVRTKALRNVLQAGSITRGLPFFILAVRTYSRIIRLARR